MILVIATLNSEKEAIVGLNLRRPLYDQEHALK